ncbi:MAG: cytochrome c biogenesis protein CcsA [Pseudomonadales bacterium]|jgi:ABC-type uncharacterized transport system permease subunit|nr:cytochrome c biogenesis protein CcsA [Pseudomonadales bacterium]
MIALSSGLVAVLLYAFGSFRQGRLLSREQADDPAQLAAERGRFLGIGALALAAHLVNVVQVIAPGGGFDFGFFKVATLFSWTMACIVVLGSLKKPLENLCVAVFPLAILSILCALFLPDTAQPIATLSPGVALHVILGILGFSLMTLAAGQALLVAWLNRELKRHHYSPVLRHLPPLQTMESLLFGIIHAGFVSLLAVILTGFLFMDDMFAQHLAHKTFFTLLATLVFGILLWGRHRWGWRGRRALHWTLAGFAVLILAYFGSKFVLEVLLNRS